MQHFRAAAEPECRLRARFARHVRGPHAAAHRHRAPILLPRLGQETGAVLSSHRSRCGRRISAFRPVTGTTSANSVISRKAVGGPRLRPPDPTPPNRTAPRKRSDALMINST
jgi:hypothetical protein